MSTPQVIFKALATIPTYTDAVILPDSNDNTLNIQVSLSQRDLERNVRRKFTRTIVASFADKSIPQVFTGPSVDAGDTIAQATSPSGKLTVVLLSVSGEKKKHFVEIWSEGSILHILETTAIHDDFYADTTFGTLEWSRDETNIVYVAERKKTEDVLEKYNYKPDWGETFTGKRDPSLVIVNVNTFDVKVLDRFEGDMSPGQCTLLTSRFLFDGMFNGRTGLYQINVDGTGLKHLTEELKSARSPRLNPDGTTMVFLSNTVNGPHASCAKLCKIDVASGKVSTVVDFVHQADTTTGFPGLYVDQLPKRLWISPTKIITSSAWRLRRTLLSIDVMSGSVQELTPPEDYPGSTTALFASTHWILTTYSTPTLPWALMLGQIDIDKQNDTTAVHFSALEVSKVEKAKPFYASHSWSIVEKIPGQLENLEALYLQPFRNDFKHAEAQAQSAVSGTKPPLVIIPHGGPHSGFAAEFSMLNTVLLGLGFAVACVNFTGSLGYGQSCVEALVGRVGELDVNECQAVRDYIISQDEVDPERICLTGGSHAGFIVAHLLKDPSYKAAVMRNPVTDIPAAISVTDNGQWGYAVNGLPFDMGSPPLATLADPEVFRKMRVASPMHHIEKVVTPTLILLGSGDRRVSPSQSIAWWQARQNKIRKEQLHGNSAVNRMQVYEGAGHALDSVESESNSTYSLGSFLVEFTRVDPPQMAAEAEGNVGRQV
ncbi:hypothetical protein BG003_010148 [Podila horticola]|nr:hypothetical protein BG003_010148 [Podila horticola]